MKIAIGSDHRGAEIAKHLVAHAFLHNCDALVARALGVSLDATTFSGAFLLDGVGIGETPEESQSASIERLELASLPVEIASSSPESGIDYPLVAAAVAAAVSEGRAERGILICGTGIGMCVAANKFRGVRAALCYNAYAAELSRRHNDANVLCLSGEFLGAGATETLVRTWLTTPFEGGRHARRLELIAAIEEETGL